MSIQQEQNKDEKGKFNLLGNVITFSDEEMSRSWVHQMFFTAYDDVEKNIYKIRDEIEAGKCEDYPQRVMEICSKYSESLLAQYLYLGRDNVARLLTDQVQEAMQKAMSDPWYKICSKLVDEYLEIISEPEKMREYRELRKANRGQWSGGGFGIKGAIIGSIKAEAMNMASEMAHTAINGIGNAYSLKKYQKKLDELKAKYLDEYEDAIIEGCKKAVCAAEGFYDLFAAQIDENAQVYPADIINSAHADVIRLQYEIADLFGVEKWEETTCLFLKRNHSLMDKTKFEYFAKCLCTIIKNYPYDWTIYEFIYKVFGDENGEADKLAQSFGVDTDYAKEKIINDSIELVDYKKEEQIQQMLDDLRYIEKYIHYKDKDIEKNLQKALKKAEKQSRTADKYVIENGEIIKKGSILFKTKEQAEIATQICMELKREYEKIDVSDIQDIQQFGNKLEEYVRNNPFMQDALIDIKNRYDENVRSVTDLKLNEEGKLVTEGNIVLANINDVPIVEDIIKHVREEYFKKTDESIPENERGNYLTELQGYFRKYGILGSLCDKLKKNLLKVKTISKKDFWSDEYLYTTATLNTYDELLKFRKLNDAVTNTRSNKELWKYIDQLRKWNKKYGLFGEKLKNAEAYDKELRTVKTNKKDIVYSSIEEAEQARARVVSGVLYKSDGEAKQAREKEEKERNIRKYGTNNKEKIAEIVAQMQLEKEQLQLCKKIIEESSSQLLSPIYFYSVIANREPKTKEGEQELYKAKNKVKKIYDEAKGWFSNYNSNEKKQILKIISIENDNIFVDNSDLSSEVLEQVNEIFEGDMETLELLKQGKASEVLPNKNNLEESQKIIDNEKMEEKNLENKPVNLTKEQKNEVEQDRVKSDKVNLEVEGEDQGVEKIKSDNEAIDELKKQLMAVKSQEKRQEILKRFTTNISTQEALKRYNKIRQKVNQTEPLFEKICHVLGWTSVIALVIFAIVPIESSLSDLSSTIFIHGVRIWLVMKLITFVRSGKEDYYKNLKNI